MQIIANLISNSIDALRGLPIDERWIQITYQQTSEDQSILIENGGPQIPKNIQDKLFQRRFSTKGKEGNGLGLYICQKLARNNKGQLSYVKEASHPTFRLITKKSNMDNVA